MLRCQYNIDFLTTLYLEILLPSVADLPVETRGTERPPQGARGHGFRVWVGAYTGPRDPEPTAQNGLPWASSLG